MLTSDIAGLINTEDGVASAAIRKLDTWERSRRWLEYAPD
jgi:hypothetical protein